MEADGAFRREQRQVALAMLAGVLATAAALAFGSMLDRAAAPMPFADRLRHALQVDTIVVGWLAIGIADVARRRFFSPRDIGSATGDAPSPAVRRAAAILQNTLEQAVLAVAAHLILVASLDRTAATVTTLACLFAVGRLFFVIGYARGAAGRAFGFALTFYPSLGALLVSAVAIVGR